MSLPEKKEILNLMDEDISRMINFIEEALDLRLLKEKKDVIEKKWTALGNLIDESLKPFQLLAKEKEISLVKRVDVNGALEVFMDALWIKQVLNNLISNAIQHSPSHSKVYIEAWVSPNETLKVAVKDEGSGFSEKETPRVFESFYKGRRPSFSGGLKNTGLGLAIAQAVVEGHGGSIGVTSSPKGCVFYFEISNVRGFPKIA